jgi:hypothetical protein
LYGQRDGADDEEFDEEEEVSRPQRTRTSIHPNGYSGYDAEDLEDASEVNSSANESGNEWQGVDDDLENDFEGDDEEEKETSGEESVETDEPESLVVQLRYGKGDASSNLEAQIDKRPPTNDIEMKDVGESTAPSSVQLLPPTLPHSSSPAVQQAPAMTTPSVSSVQIPQVPTQHTPVVAAPITTTPAPKPEEVIPQGLMATSSTHSPQESLDAGAEAPKTSQSIELNGVNQS